MGTPRAGRDPARRDRSSTTGYGREVEGHWACNRDRSASAGTASSRNYERASARTEEIGFKQSRATRLFAGPGFLRSWVYSHLWSRLTQPSHRAASWGFTHFTFLALQTSHDWGRFFGPPSLFSPSPAPSPSPLDLLVPGAALRFLDGAEDEEEEEDPAAPEAGRGGSIAAGAMGG